MCILTQYAVEMRVCAEKNCGADISNRRGNAKRCLECARNRYWECERAYFKSPKGRGCSKEVRAIPQAPRPAEGVRAGLSSIRQGQGSKKKVRAIPQAPAPGGRSTGGLIKHPPRARQQ